MESGAVVMMVILLVLIWGGLAYTLQLAFKRERMKK